MYIRNIYRHSYIILIKVTYSIQHTVLHKFINIYASQNSTVECVQIFKTNQLNVGSFATSVAYSSLNKYSIIIQWYVSKYQKRTEEELGFEVSYQMSVNAYWQINDEEHIELEDRSKYQENCVHNEADYSNSSSQFKFAN